MTKRTIHLDEEDMRNAIAYWLKNGEPENVGEMFTITFNYDRPANANPLDPGNGFSADARPIGNPNL